VQTRHALEQVLRATPYAGFELDPPRVGYHRVMSYDGSRSVVAGVTVDDRGLEWRLNECDSLWKKLWDRYGANSSQTLVAVISRDALPFASCPGSTGLASRIPSGIPYVNPGGIAWAAIPTPGEGDPFPSRFGPYSTLAHELYHAELDRRHVSKDHGEDNGCSLGLLMTIGAMVGYDGDCFKHAPYVHGTMGEYPEGYAKCDEAQLRTRANPYVIGTYRKLGCRGTPIPFYQERGRLRGDRGGMGIDIHTGLYTEGNDVIGLVLYDPCPTAPSADPLSAVSGRWDRSTGAYSCAADEPDKAHDFMSYGPYRWASAAQFRWPRFHLVEPRD
jgi:hypothetical protein